MKLCVDRRESGPARVPRSTLWTGVVLPQSEEVTSTGHSSRGRGENVTVTQNDDYVSFEKKKGFISNAENNVVLTEEHAQLCKMAAQNPDDWHLKQAVGRGRHSVANTVSHGEQPNAKTDTQPNLCIFHRFGTVHCGVRLHQQPKLHWGLLCE